MFRKKLQYKLFFIFLVTVSLVVAMMQVMMYWSFKRGFVDYLNQSDSEQLTPVIERLQRYYERHGDWQGLIDNRNVWIKMTAPDISLGTPSNRPAHPPSQPPPNQGWGMQPEGMPPPFPAGAAADTTWGYGPPPQAGNRREQGSAMDGPRHQQTSSYLAVGPRLSLFDSEQNYLLGKVYDLKKLSRFPIMVDEKTVGWLGLEALTSPNQNRDMAFLQQQATNHYLIAALSLLITAVVSIMLAQRLLRPIQALAHGARSLTQGDYRTQVAVNSHDELGQLANDFNTLADTLSSNESARRRWIADISHELRTPLAVLRGEVEAMQDGIRPTNTKSLHSLHAEVGQLNKLIDDLYQLSLSDLGALNYQKQQQDLNEILEQTCDSFQCRFDNAKIQLHLITPDIPLFALVDGERISQLLHNLLENTLRYTDAGGRLEITTAIEGDEIIVDLHDSAPGVSEELLPKLFDPLYRTDSSRNRAKGGAGLGLAIVRNIVSAHQGRISAQTSRLGGLWIQITLPQETGVPS